MSIQPHSHRHRQGVQRSGRRLELQLQHDDGVFSSAESAGEKPWVSVDPDTGYIDIINKAHTAKRNTGYSLVASRLKGNGGDSLLVQRQ